MSADNPQQNSGFKTQKKVDESWKDSISKEKEFLSPETEKGAAEQEKMTAAEASFSFFLSTLGMQALTALGEIANPSTGEKSVELDQAKYLIDIIQMLSEKTKNNLSAEENSMMDGLLYELRLKFVQKSQRPA